MTNLLIPLWIGSFVVSQWDLLVSTVRDLLFANKGSFVSIFHLYIFCQAQFQFQSSRTEYSLNPDYFYPHPPTPTHPQGSRNLESVESRILDNLPSVRQMRLGRRPSLQTELSQLCIC